MKKASLILMCLLIVFGCMCFAHAQEATVTAEVLDMTVDEFVSTYNTGITGLLELDAVKAYSVTDTSIAYPANKLQDISLLLQTAGENMRGVGIVMGNNCTDFEEYLAIANRAIAIIAPDTTETERHDALM